MRRFEDQVVVITGSATGIGAATAQRFAAEGARVACLDINDADNEAHRRDGSGRGGRGVGAGLRREVPR